MKKINEIKDLKDKKIILRVDFDVPIRQSSGQAVIEESFRIQKQKKTVDYLISKGARVLMVAHISDIDSFEPVLPELNNILGRKVVLIKGYKEIGSVFERSPNDSLFLLDNIRKWKGEKDNDKEFAKELTKGFDIYVNNAFAVSHRAHASVSAITEALPSYAGFIMEEEIANLKKALEYPPNGKIFIMGGAKASTKLPVIKNFLDKADRILIGGVIANDFLKKQGVNLGDSKFDEDYEELLTGLDMNSSKLFMPVDYNISEGKYLDIGPESVANFKKVISQAKMIIWNGPMGMFEDEKFAHGTDGVAQAVAESQTIKIIGGGDTIAAINKFGLMDKFELAPYEVGSDLSGPLVRSGFVSTGGGAMLEFLAGNRLPGLEALGYYK